MQIIDKIVKTQNGPLSGNVLWLDSKERKLKFLSDGGWKALNDESADVTEMKEAIEDASNLHPIVSNPNSTSPSEPTEVTFPYSKLYYKGYSYEKGQDAYRSLKLGVTANNGANYLQALYYTSGSQGASLLLRPQYLDYRTVKDLDAYIEIFTNYKNLKDTIYLHTSESGVYVDDLVSAMNKTNTLLSASTTIEKLSDDAALSDVVAKCNEVITTLGALGLIKVTEAETTE